MGYKKYLSTLDFDMYFAMLASIEKVPVAVVIAAVATHLFKLLNQTALCIQFFVAVHLQNLRKVKCTIFWLHLYVYYIPQACGTKMAFVGETI